MFIFIPPEGVQVGDTVLGAPSVGFEFFSSEGESRGYADVVVVDRALGESLRGRVTAVLQHPEQSGT